MNNTIDWFELPAEDFKRAVKFYEESFQVKMDIHQEPKKMAFFPQDKNMHGAGGAISESAENFRPVADGIMVYFSVQDISLALERIEKAGGKVLLPKTSVGEFGSVGYFSDTEGNRMGLHTV